MYTDFYYAELLILIPPILSAFFLYLASSKRLDGDLRFLSIVISSLIGVLFFLMMCTSGVGRTNSPDTSQAIEFLRKADKTNVDVNYFNMYFRMQLDAQ